MNSPEGAKSMVMGACLKVIQSMRRPVSKSHTRMLLSKELANSHLESGYEKHISVILFLAAFSKVLMVLKLPILAFITVIVRLLVEKATKSLILL